MNYSARRLKESLWAEMNVITLTVWYNELLGLLLGYIGTSNAADYNIHDSIKRRAVFLTKLFTF
jgi:hypothetical protein